MNTLTHIERFKQVLYKRALRGNIFKRAMRNSLIGINVQSDIFLKISWTFSKYTQRILCTVVDHSSVSAAGLEITQY